MNPNHRMPGPVDHAPAGGGEPIAGVGGGVYAIFESGAIMMYVAEKEGKFFPQAMRPRHLVTQWLIWQMANQGPKAANAVISAGSGHQGRPGLCGDPLHRRGEPAVRLLNNRLFENRYLSVDEYTIADMISYPWTVNWKAQGQDIADFKHFKRWFEELGARPGVQRAWRSARIWPRINGSAPFKATARQAAVHRARTSGAGVGPHPANTPPSSCGRGRGRVARPPPPNPSRKGSGKMRFWILELPMRDLECFFSSCSTPWTYFTFQQLPADAEGAGDRHRLAADPPGRRRVGAPCNRACTIRTRSRCRRSRPTGGRTERTGRVVSASEGTSCTNGVPGEQRPCDQQLRALLEPEGKLVPFALATFEARGGDDKEISQVPVLREISGKVAASMPTRSSPASSSRQIKDKLRAGTPD